MSLRECPLEFLKYFWIGPIPENPENRTLIAALPDDLAEDDKDKFENLMLSQLYAVCDHCDAALRVSFLYPHEAALIGQKIELEALLGLSPDKAPDEGTDTE